MLQSYKTKTDPVTFFSVLLDSVQGQLETPEITVSGLQPFSFYSFYVKVSRPGVNGIGQPSELVNVTTKCDGMFQIHPLFSTSNFTNTHFCIYF